MNRRRKLVIGLGAGALIAPFTSFAQQQGKVWRVGFLAQRQVATSETDYFYGPFRQGMRELGYVEGKNLVIEWRSAEGKSERLLDLATELVNIKVDVIVAPGTPATSAAQKATTTIPIVMVNTYDPVGSGLIKSLARPGGNITGLSGIGAGLMLKQLEILLSMVPKRSRVAILVNPINKTNIDRLEIVQAEGQKRGIRVLREDARTSQEIDNAFLSMRQQNASALIVSTEAFFQQQNSQIVELAAKYKLPSIASYREYVDAGGLMSYGNNIRDHNRRAATYVDKILKGAKPGDIPVEQPTKFELFINGMAARELGLKIPQSLLIIADKVIE